MVEVEVKSTAGRRGIALPDQLLDLIIEHRKRQDQEREHAGTEWHEGGWMFAQLTGKRRQPAVGRSAARRCRGPHGLAGGASRIQDGPAKSGYPSGVAAGRRGGG
jgi:hypothetical protein